MTPRFEAFSVVVSDMARSLAFYRKLGLEFPDGAESEDHVEAQLGPRAWVLGQPAGAADAQPTQLVG